MQEGFYGQQLLRLPQIVSSWTKDNEQLSALQIQAIGYFPQAKHHDIHRPKGMVGCEDHYLLNYCTNGKGWCVLEGERYEVLANQYFIFPMDKPHAYGADSDNPWSVYWIRFNGSLSGYYSEGKSIPTTILPGIESRIEYRQQIFEEMFNTLDKGYTIPNLCYASSLLQLYLTSLKYINTFNSANKRLIVTTEFNVVPELIHYMEENVEKRISLEMFSKYSGYSISQMSSIFRKETGYSPVAYFNMLKIKRSCWFLQNTTLKLNQICHKIGFNDSYYFSRLFKRIMGVSPTEFKEECY